MNTIVKRIVCLLAAVCLTASCCIAASAEEEKELTNIAVGQYIEATSSYHPPEDFFNENYIVDGVWETYPDSPHLGWNTDTVGEPVTEDTVVDITLFLDHAYKIEKIVLKPMKWNDGRAFPRDYQLQASPDGSTWTDVASATNMNVEAAIADLQPVVYEIEPTAMKYFRIHITRNSANVDRGGSTTSALGELELWGYACDDSELPVPPARTYTATFVAGNTTVAKVEFKTGDKTLAEPAVPEKEGYTGKWAAYTLKDADIVIRAVYTPAGEDATEAPTEAPTEALTEAPTETQTEAVTEAPTQAVTEAPTQAATEAATDAPAADTSAGTETDSAAPADTGCASALSLGMLAFVLPAAAFVFGRRKH